MADVQLNCSMHWADAEGEWHFCGYKRGHTQDWHMCVCGAEKGAVTDD